MHLLFCLCTQYDSMLVFFMSAICYKAIVCIQHGPSWFTEQKTRVTRSEKPAIRSFVDSVFANCEYDQIDKFNIFILCPLFTTFISCFPLAFWNQINKSPDRYGPPSHRRHEGWTGKAVEAERRCASAEATSAPEPEKQNAGRATPLSMRSMSGTKSWQFATPSCVLFPFPSQKVLLANVKRLIASKQQKWSQVNSAVDLGLISGCLTCCSLLNTVNELCAWLG